MATKGGPLMVRHVIDGREVLLPADAVLAPPAPKGADAKWLEQQARKPLPGTY